MPILSSPGCTTMLVRLGSRLEALNRKRGFPAGRHFSNCAINLDGFVGVSVPRESRRARGSHTDLLAIVVPFQQGAGSLSPRGHIGDRTIERGISAYFAEHRQITGDHRTPASHRLDYRQGEPFGV